MKRWNICESCGYEEDYRLQGAVSYCPKCSKETGKAVIMFGDEMECPKCGKRMRYHIKPYNDRWECTNFFCRYKTKNLYKGMEGFYERERKFGMTSEQEAKLRKIDARMPYI